MDDLKPEERDALIELADGGDQPEPMHATALALAGLIEHDWGPWQATPAGKLLAQSLKREREARRKPVARVVVEDVRFHICDGTAFRGAPDDLVMGKSIDEELWNEHALFGRGFPHFDFDPPVNERRHYVVVEVYEGWPDETPPETER